MNQQQLILNHINEHGSISSIEAFAEYGITRLSAVVFILRKKGIPVISKDEHSKNRYGRTVWYSRYFIGGKDDEQIPFT